MKGFLFAIALLASACASYSIPAGHVGMVRTPSGFDGNVLHSGNTFLFGRDRLYLIEVTDHQETVHMAVLCTDQINFSFDVGTLVSVDKSNSQRVIDLFENQTPGGEYEGSPVVSAKQLFATYVKPVLDQESRRVISPYTTGQIIAHRSQIIEEIRAAISVAMKGSVMQVKQVTVNNDDYPEIITKAQESKVARQISVETERAEQERRLVEATNQLKLAEIHYKQQLVEAATVADSNRLIGASITPEYLGWWQLKVLGQAASGPNNWGFIPYTDFVSGALKERTSMPGLVDAELIARLKSARTDAVKLPDTVTRTGGAK